MKTSTTFLFAAIAALSPLVSAHGSVSVFTGSGKSYDGPLPAGAVISSPVRQIDNLEPIKDTTSTDMTCGFGASPSASQVAPVSAGSVVNFDWRSGIPGVNWPHTFGPLMTYMAKCPTTADKCDASTLKWFKTDQQGLRPDGTWFQAEINAGHAFNTTIPNGLEDGDYLVRHEIIALHNAMTLGLAEFYVSCTQVRVSGGGSASPSSSQLVSFPGAYSATDPGILINIFNGLKSYPYPGPSLFVGTGSAAPASSSSSSSSTAPTGKAKPKKCNVKSHKRMNSRVMRRLVQQELAGASSS
jgi:cellulase